MDKIKLRTKSKSGKSIGTEGHHYSLPLHNNTFIFIWLLNIRAVTVRRILSSIICSRCMNQFLDLFYSENAQILNVRK